MQEVESLIRAKQQEMERSTLTIKEEKARLHEMKRMKDDAKKAMVWETEFDDVKNKRAQVGSATPALRAACRHSYYRSLTRRSPPDPAAFGEPEGRVRRPRQRARRAVSAGDGDRPGDTCGGGGGPPAERAGLYAGAAEQVLNIPRGRHSTPTTARAHADTRKAPRRFGRLDRPWSARSLASLLPSRLGKSQKKRIPNMIIPVVVG